jgi:hypothetical protein
MGKALADPMAKIEQELALSDEEKAVRNALAGNNVFGQVEGNECPRVNAFGQRSGNACGELLTKIPQLRH